ncbi:MAG: cobalamin B12-binding domain-containing protein [Methylocystaceae bacterium]|nr:cobalamin B12-binding domain-containing protein [Methylocystaceae bacterium]
MKICLIRPPILCPKSHPIVQMTPPIGLAYVAGSLRDAGYEVTVIDGLAESFDTRHNWGEDCYLYGLSIEQILDGIDETTDVIGVSAAFTFEWPVCRELIKQLRERFPNVRLIGGGEHITALPELSMEETPLEVGVLGEGEEIVINLVKAFEANETDLSKIGGIVYRNEQGDIVRNERHNRIRELDDIPRPAWEYLPIEQYLDRGFGFGVTRGRSMPVIASRGCPYQCTFCSNPKMWTTRWVVRSVDNMLDELEYYQKTYGAQNFDFYDLTAIVKKTWIVEFCEKIEQRRMKFTWQLPSGTRSEAIDDEVSQLLYKSGCRNLSYSPESGSPTVLARIKKKIKTEAMLTSLRSTVNAGMNIKLNIMFGFPGETYKEIRESFKFICQMAWAGGHDLSIWAFSPYPGSELFDQLYKEGKIKMDDAYYDDLRSYSDMSRCKSFSEHIDNKTLMRLRWLGTVLFYGVGWLRRPWRPFRMVWNGFTGRHESRSDLVITSLLRRMKLVKKSKEAG